MRTTEAPIAELLGGPRLDSHFYERADVVTIARELLGAVLHTRIDGVHVAGMITATEAYAGVADRASHAWNGRRTARNASMYASGGTAYVFLCYGIHHLFNVVTHVRGVPHAVLIRGIHPLIGSERMSERRGAKGRLTTNGPGTAAQALGIDRGHDGVDLTGDLIWLTGPAIGMRDTDVIVGTRIGVEYAGPDALLPYRFELAPHFQQTLP